jgi:hypothetical protein
VELGRTIPEGDPCQFSDSAEYGDKPGVRISEFKGELKCEDEIELEGVVPLDKPELG